MPSLASLHAVDRVTAHLCAQLRASARITSHGQLVLLKDIPVQYRAALARQGVRDMLMVGDEPALRLAQVEGWLTHVKRAFHGADSAETVKGVTWLRRFNFAGINDGELNKREVKLALEQGEKQGVGPAMNMVAKELGLPLLPKSEGAKCLPPPAAQVLPQSLIDKLLRDDRVDTHEVWQLAHRARLNDKCTAGRDALTRLRDTHGGSFTKDARAALDEYLAKGVHDGTTAQAHEGLRRLWQQTREEWDLTAITPPARDYSVEEMLRLAKPLYDASNEEGYRLANEVREFFTKYPSTGGRSLSAFFSGWAINETFGVMPLLAYDYSQAHPVDKEGKPRGPLWRAYVAAVRSGAPRDVIEEAFLRAHIADYKHATLSPTFRKLYQISPQSYRKVVDAYVDTLRTCEAELDNGTKPSVVARFYPLAVTRDLVKRGTIGMQWNEASFRNGSDYRNPLTREWWFGFWGMLGTFFFGAHPKVAKADAIAVDVSRAERRELREALDLELPAGIGTIDAEAIAKATFAEPPRGDVAGMDLPRYRLALSDFSRVDPIHAPMPVSGTDGVFQAKEILGVVRQAQARVRSNLIHDFQAKYPTPMNGLLEYSANMLALTGSYHQHKAYGMVPQFIMPVDNFGRPKTAKWQAYVDAHESGRASKQTIERLWFEAHMEDFQQLDSPEFREQAQLFWRDAIRDPALAPLATYFIAMVHGRDVYDQACAEKLPYEEALVRSFDHFRQTLFTAGTVPFLGEEVRKVTKLFTGALTGSNGPELDERGLPTDATLTKRMLEGLATASGITGTLLRGGVLNARDAEGKHIAVHTVGDSLVDLAEVMSPDELAKVDPAVRAYYANPTSFTGDSHVAMVGTCKKAEGLYEIIAKAMNDAVIHVTSYVGGAVIGTKAVTSGEFPVEDELRKDRKGDTHWNRYIVDAKGQRKALFLATFGVENGQIKETFESAVGVKVPLYFDVDAYRGGVRLKLDKERSSKLLTTFADVVFHVLPAKDGRVSIRGQLFHQHLANGCSTFDAVMAPLGAAGEDAKVLTLPASAPQVALRPALKSA